MTTIDEEIERAKKMLSLPPGWGDKEELQVSTFAFDYADNIARRMFSKAPLVPRITPEGSGGVDLHWRGAGYELLINCPPDGDYPTYYGDDRSGSSPAADRVKGTLHSGQETDLLASWLAAKAKRAVDLAGDPS